MRKLTLFAAFVFSVNLLFAQAPNHVVISQVYGGGGNNTSVFRNDFIELYNPTAAAVSLSGWSLQYAAAASAFASKVDLTGSISPGKYYLVQLSGGPTGMPLPAPDASANFIMSAGSGKVALVNNTNMLTGNCASGPAIIDLVGYGTSDCFEGADGTPVISNTTAALRKNNGCTDTDDNEADFVEQAPAPRSSASAGHTCGVNITITNVQTQPFCVTGSSSATGVVTYTSNTALAGNLNAYLSSSTGSYSSPVLVGSAAATGNSGTINISIPAGTASGTSFTIRVDATTPEVYGAPSAPFEVINGAKNVTGIYFSPTPTQLTVNWTNPAGCFDEVMMVGKAGSSITAAPSGNGSAYTANPDYNGNGTAFDGGKVLYKGTQNSQTITGLTTGQVYYFKIFTRRGTIWSTGIESSATPRKLPVAGDVVINQLNPGYSGAGNEYIELVNNTAEAINLSELSLGYQSGTGGQNIAPSLLSGTLPPHGYWLLAPSALNTITVGKTSNLSRDGVFSFAMSGTAGQVALIRNTDNQLLDAFGYGTITGGDYTEGNTPASPSANSGYKRTTDGIDNNNNAADFAAVSAANIDLRNSTSRLANTGAAITGGSYARMYVTGNSGISGNVFITEKLVFVNGKLSLGNFNLQTAASEGYGVSSYARTNGNGVFIQTNIGTAPVLLPAGNSTYNPITIAKGSGQSWEVRVEDTLTAQNSNQAVKRTWHIAPLQSITTGADITFSYNDGDPSQLGTNFNTAEEVQVWHYNGSAWQKAGPGQEPAGSPGGTRTVTLANWTRFSPFALANASVVLPLQFDVVRLQQAGKDLIIHFTVHGEEDVRHYEVETSVNGTTFTRKAVMLPRNNRGGTVQYTYTDAMPVGTDRYYRIRAVEQDGKSRFSAVVKVAALAVTAPFQIRPNPVEGSTVQYVVKHLAPGAYTVRIWDAAGRLVKTEHFTHAGGAIWGSLTAPSLQRGWYLLDIHGQAMLRQSFVVK